MRDLTTAFKDELVKSEVSPILLFEGLFTTGYVRAWSGYGELTWDAKTWLGTGTLLSVSEMTETADTSAQGITVMLNGIPSSVISLVLNETKQGALGKIYLGFLTTSGSLIADPFLMFEGRLDVPTIDDGGEYASVGITYESRLIDLRRPRFNKYTKADQARFFPNDKGLDFVPGLQERSILWKATG